MIFLNLPVMLLEIDWKMGLQSSQLIMTPLYTEFSLMLKTFTPMDYFSSFMVWNLGSIYGCEGIVAAW